MISFHRMFTPALSSTNNHPDSTPPAVPALIAILEQLERLLNSLSDEQYARKPVGLLNSSVGGHIRHCLDHVDALLAAAKSRRINYDQRARNTQVERHRLVAMRTIRTKIQEIGCCSWPRRNAPIGILTLLNSDEPSIESITTLDRELAFVVSHTIHHCALIGVMAAMMDVTPPEGFGYAPATLAHRKNQLCVR